MLMTTMTLTMDMGHPNTHMQVMGSITTITIITLTVGVSPTVMCITAHSDIHGLVFTIHQLTIAVIHIGQPGVTRVTGRALITQLAGGHHLVLAQVTAAIIMTITGGITIGETEIITTITITTSRLKGVITLHVTKHVA